MLIFQSYVGLLEGKGFVSVDDETLHYSCSPLFSCCCAYQLELAAWLTLKLLRTALTGSSWLKKNLLAAQSAVDVPFITPKVLSPNLATAA